MNTLHIRRSECHDAGDLVQLDWAKEQWPRGKGFWSISPHIRFRMMLHHVIELDDVVVGCMVFSVDRRRVVIEKFMIGHEWRRLGMGTMALGRIVQRANKSDRIVVTTIPELDRRAIAFLKSCGWTAIRVQRDYYRDCDGLRFSSPNPSREVTSGQQVPFAVEQRDSFAGTTQ